MVRPGLAILCAALMAACSSSPGADSGVPDGGPGSDAGPVPDSGPHADSGPPADAGADAGSVDAGPTGLSLDAGPVACPDGGACIWVDPLTAGRVVPPELFGDQIPDLSSGTFLWTTPSSPSCAGLTEGAARPELMSLFGELGITVLRYPSGTPGDFFFWEQAIGPVGSRVPQIDPFSSSNTTLVYDCPVFGPDEFAGVAHQLGTEILINTNVGTSGDAGAQEAAAWLRYYEDAGVRAQYWEIGNENYINSPIYFFSAAYKSPAQYTAIFNAQATALRAVDPTIKVGAIVTDQASWNSVVVAGVQQPDFYAIHVGYAPSACLAPDGGISADDAWRSTLANTLIVRYRLDQTEQQLAQYAPGLDAGLAMTEHAASWGTCSSDIPTVEIELQPNYELGSALYSALLYNLMMADPKMVMANHINVSSPYFQAAVRTDLADGHSNPVKSPFFFVFSLYAQSGRATLLPAKVSGSPTYDALVPFGIMPPVAGVPTLEAVAVEPPAGDRLWIYVVNRDLTRDASASVAINGLVAHNVTAEVVDGPQFDSANSAVDPNTVTLSTSSLPPGNPLTYTFPAHSLTRLTVR
jgi:alpha-L-arabinofuranosidase